MQRVFLSFFIVLVLAVVGLTQDRPFEKFEKAIKEERAGFAGNKGNLSKVFNDERLGLGERFEAELWTYLGTDPEKHYWIASFLTSKSYLHGSKPLYPLADTIWTKALELIGKRNDKHSLGRKVSINRELALSARIADRRSDAGNFRDSAEKILAQNNDIGAYVAGRTEYDICIYNNIDGIIDRCDPDPPPKEKIISAGWMNNRANNFTKPEYPSGLSGSRRVERVEVRILTDENGNVITAEIIRGRQEFHKAAIEAARKLTFPPTRLSGVLIKVSGWISYDFNP